MPKDSTTQSHAANQLATERQLAYARDLGVQVPDGASKATVSSLISAANGYDKPARHGLLDAARSYGVVTHPAMGKREVFAAIHSKLAGPDHDVDMASWFAFRVYRNLVHGSDDAAIDHPGDPKLIAVAHELAAQPSVMRSIRRYESRDVIWFGTWTSPNGALLQGGSNKTVAYKTAAGLLRPLIAAEARARQLVEAHKRWEQLQAEEALERAHVAETPPLPQPVARRGCFGNVLVLCVGFVVTLVGAGLVIRLLT